MLALNSSSVYRTIMPYLSTLPPHLTRSKHETVQAYPPDPIEAKFPQKHNFYSNIKD